MARAASASSKPRKGGGKKKKVVAAFDALQSQKAALHGEYSKSKKTKSTYSGYLDRARDIIADVVEKRRAEAKTAQGLSDGIDTDLLAVALNGKPNKLSATALELCITQKCVVEGLSKSTAEGLHGAWANYWDGL